MIKYKNAKSSLPLNHENHAWTCDGSIMVYKWDILKHTVVSLAAIM